MKGFRIALNRFGATPQEAFSGKSGFTTDGRWHTHGRYLDYTSQSRSLATLERLVHYKRFNRLAPHILYIVDIPDDAIESVVAVPKGWNGDDLLPAAQALGDEWCDRARSPAYQVPSAVTPGESNLILNSRHPDWDWHWVITGPEKFEFDARLADLLP